MGGLQILGIIVGIILICFGTHSAINGGYGAAIINWGLACFIFVFSFWVVK